MFKTKIRTINLKGTVIFAVIAIILVTFTSTHPISVYASENNDLMSYSQSAKNEIVDIDSDSSNSISGYDQHLAEHRAAKEELEQKAEEMKREQETTDAAETTTANSNDSDVDVAAMQQAILQDYMNQSEGMQDKREQFEKDEESIYQRINDINSVVHPVSNAFAHPSAKTIIALILLFLLVSVGGVILRALITRSILFRKNKQKSENGDNTDNSNKADNSNITDKSSNHQSSTDHTDLKTQTASDAVIDEIVTSEAAAHGCEF